MTTQPSAPTPDNPDRLLTSQHTGRQYRVTMALPLGYDSQPGEAWPFAKPPAKWPVVYVLDGNWYAGMVTDITRLMAWCGGTDDAIVVGIGYPAGANPIDSARVFFTRRDADLTPTRDEAEQKSMGARHSHPAPNGDAAGFLKFLQLELIPLIEQEYRADPTRRVLLGHSYGGLFGLYSMFEAPGLFPTLVLGSPTLVYGERFVIRQEEAFAQSHKSLPAAVYLFAGELEEDSQDTTLTDTLRMAATLQGREYDGLTLTQHIFPGLNHCEVAAPGFQWGLKQALKK